MPTRATNLSCTNSPARACVLLLTLGLTACSQVGVGGVVPSLSDDDVRDGGVVGARATGARGDAGADFLKAVNPVLPCGQATKRAAAVLSTYCTSCIGSPTTEGSSNTATDVGALLASGKVIPGKPEASLLYQQLAAGTMPPRDAAERPSEADVEAVKEWIACGAPRWTDTGASTYSFVSIDGRLHGLLSDLRAQPNPVDRKRFRYIDLSTLANAGFSKDQIQVYREAVFFLLNSLSHSRDVVKPVAIDADKLMYRIDLREFSWDAATWSALEESYPYTVVYNQNSRLFPFDEATAQQVRTETGTSIPVIQADWLLSHASRPPLYHTMLELPATLSALGTQLGVNIAGDIAAEQVERAGFANAGASRNDRVIERHELSGNRGALWLSYDFTSNLGRRNVFAHPLDFQADGNSLIFNLDNGLQAYFVSDAAGKRLDKVPNSIMQDPRSRDGAVENGLSCMGCHQQAGALAQKDEIRSSVRSNAKNAAEIAAVLGLYPEPAVLDSAFYAGQEMYGAALAELGVSRLNETTLHDLDDTHLGVLNIEAVSAVLGIETSALERALDASPQAFPRELVALRVQGGLVHRDAFDAVVGDTIKGLGLGVQLLAGDPLPVAPTTPAEPALDAGVVDGGTVDADAGVNPDLDAGAADAGIRDAGGRDAGVRDAGRIGTVSGDAGHSTTYYTP